ncbi:MAG: hypothetical protein ACI4SF_12905 [Oscillospiraceae bacterium]
MSEREKLLKILYDMPEVQTLKENADYLLEHGVIVPPVKVGDTVYTNISWQGWYLREKDKPYKAKVVFIGINGKQNFINVVYEKNDNMLSFTFDEIGDRLFLTREEAENALKLNE